MEYLHKKAVDIPLYRGKLVLFITNSVTELQKYIPDFEGNLYAHAWLINYNNKEGFSVVLNFDNKNREIYPGVIAHEALHAANFILESRGIVASFDNDEACAYLVEWITDQIHLFIKSKEKVIHCR